MPGHSVMSGTPAPLPEAFRAPRLLRWLNIVAVGSSLAAATGLVLGVWMGTEVALPSCAATLFFGLVWARVVRARRKGRPVGWAMAIPLAAMNAGATFCLVRGASALGFVAAATVGVVVWGPALAVTLVIFGVPLYRAQRAADRGLGSEDRGERIVAGVAAAVAALTLIALPLTARVIASRPPEDENTRPTLPSGWLAVVAASGLAAGLAAGVYATRRERARRVFVADVASGAAIGYRIDPQPDGASLLVRLDAAEAGYYRTPRFIEPIVELDPFGEAMRTL